MKKTYNLDLQDYDTSVFEENPAVTMGFNYSIPAIGWATISNDKKTVEVNFVDTDDAKKIAEMPLALRIAYKDKTLLGLALVAGNGL